MGMVIVVSNEKGGVGKSTLSINMAVQAKLSGSDVVLVDADKAGRAIKWQSFRKANEREPFIPVYHMTGRIAQDVANLASRHELVIVDVGAAIGEELQNALVVADVVLIPVRPSTIDTLSLETMMGLLRTVERRTGQRPASSIVISCASTNPMIREADETIEAIRADTEFAEFFGLCETVVHDRIAFRRAFTDGIGVAESTDKKAADEIAALLNELKKEFLA